MHLYSNSFGGIAKTPFYRKELFKILLAMKLTVFLILIGCLHVSANGYSQNVTLTAKNVPLEKVFKRIQSQTGYGFFYDKAWLKKASNVTIDVKNIPLGKALDLCFADQPLTYDIIGQTIVVKQKEVKVAIPIPEDLFAKNLLVENADKLPLPPVLVRGVVKNEGGEPIDGASIVLKGTRTGTTTNALGEFSLEIPESGLPIEISAVGYEKTEIRGVSGRIFTVVLKQSILSTEEVVINTGLFRKSEQSFTGSITTVTAKELAEFGNRNLITSLRNIDPSFNIIESNAFGSNPNRLPEIQIRGNSSIPNITDLKDQARVDLNTPLIIIDGFQSSLRKMYDLNENEIENISILKDAAATSMYGSRGANGVIVIMTRPPLMGKLRLSLRSDINFETPDLSAYSLLNARDKLDLEYLAGYYSHQRAELDLPLKRYYNYLLDEVNRGVETDWMAIPLRNGTGQRHNLRLEGGDRQFRYSASAQYNDIEGVMKKSYRRTFNGSISLAYTYRNLRIKNNLQVLQGKTSESPYGSFSDYSRLNAYWTPYDSTGRISKILGHPGNLDYTGFWSSGLPGNPMFNATLKTLDKTATTEIFNTTSIEWTIIQNLMLRVQLGLTKGVVQSDRFRPSDHTAFLNYTSADVFRKGDYLYGIRNYMNYDGSVNLQYSKVFNGKHIITAGADYNIRQNSSSFFEFLAEGFPNANFDFISMALQYAQDGKPGGSESMTRAVGLTGTVNYIYDGRYFIDGSYRVDGASQFGTNRKFAEGLYTGVDVQTPGGKDLQTRFWFTDNFKLRRVDLFDQLFGLDRDKKAIKVASIPFELEDGYLFLEATLNNSSRKLRFLFDTGSDGMMVSKSLGNELKLEISREQQASAVGGQIDIQVSENNILHFEGFNLDQQSIAVFGDQDAGYDGIIGNTILKRYITHVDYDRKEMTLYSPGKFSTDPSSEKRLAADVKTGNILVDAEVHLGKGSSVPGKFTFDTGAGYSMIVYRPTVLRYKMLVSGFTQDSIGATVSMGITTPVFHGKAHHVSFKTDKEWLIPDFPITLMGSSQFTANWNPDADGSLGVKFISGYNFTVNLVDQYISFEKRVSK